MFQNRYAILFKKDSNTGVFPVNIAKFLGTASFNGTPPMAVPDISSSQFTTPQNVPGLVGYIGAGGVYFNPFLANAPFLYPLKT